MHPPGIMGISRIAQSPLRSSAGRLLRGRRAFSTSGARQATWGFVGLGRMGFPIAKNLRAKVPVTDTMIIYDLNTDITQRFLDEHDGKGVEIANTPREVADGSETIFTALPEPSHVKNVFRGMLYPQSDSAHDRLFIDLSTIDPLSSREVARAVHNTRQGAFVDAPMSGGVVGAQAGTLTFMLGAPESLLDRINPILSMLGRHIIHCGDQGLGLSAKLANNYLLAVSNIATAEAMNLGIKWGLDPKVLGNLINASSGKCWSSSVNNPVAGVVEGSPASKGYDGGFSVGLMTKDLHMAIAAAKEAGARLELDQKTQEIYEALEKTEDYKTKDFSVVYKYLGGTE